MPSVVLSSFLPKASRITQEDLKMCQCPQSCFLHFYTNTGVINLGYYDYVSMPSVVLSSFLQIRKINCFQDHWVSMPSVVLSSFLQANAYVEKMNESPCQCPQSCFLHFYVYIDFSVFSVNLCQCPQSCFLHFYIIAISQ